MNNENEREFTEEELKKVMGGFQNMYGNEHPFNERDYYGEYQQPKLNELEEQLREIEEAKTSRGRR